MFALLSRRLLLSLVLWCLGLAAISAPAMAHAILMDSTPAFGSVVKAGVTPIILRFNSRIDVKRSRVTLVGPDQTVSVLPVSTDEVGATLRSVATLVPGANVLRWQVLAIDGHITRGEVSFSVGAP